MGGLTIDGKRVRRIVVSRLRFLGDVILTTPLLRALKEADPEIEIAYLVEDTYAPVLEHHPHVDQLWTIQRRPGSAWKDWRQMRHLRARMRHFDPDVTIDLLGIPRSAYILWLSGAPIRIGEDRRGRRWFYTHRIQHASPQVSAIHYHLENLKPFGIEGPFSAEQLQTYVHVTPKELDWADKYLGHITKGHRPLIGIHPGATWPAKRWFPEHFGELARRLTSELGAKVLITASREELGIQSDVYRSSGEAAVPLPPLKLRSLAALLARLDVYVSNDCGPMHLAVAVGTPTIGLFGPGEPNIWFPYPAEKGHRYLHHPCPEHPCHRDFCDDMSCFRDLTVDEVVEAVSRALDTRRSVAAVSR